MSETYLQTTVGKFIFRVKAGLLYTTQGLWLARDDTSGHVRVGLSDFAQQSSGDVAFVRLPAPGQLVAAGTELAAVETVKVDLELTAPFDAQVVAANEALDDAPELINQDPYGRGWLADLQPAHWPADGLLSADLYLRLITAQAESEASP